MTQPQLARAACLGIFMAFVPAIAVAADAGLADLDKAIEQKLEVRNISDLSKVIDLLQAALNKGLDDQNTTFAQQLLSESLLERAAGLTGGLTKQAPPVERAAWMRIWTIATADVKRVLQLQAKSPRAHLLLGRLQSLVGKRAPAVEALDACVASVTDEQTELLAQDRKDEVGGPFGQKLQLSLGPVEPSLAENATGSDGDFGLDDVVARAQWVLFRVEKGDNTLALVVVHEMP